MSSEMSHVMNLAIHVPVCTQERDIVGACVKGIEEM